MCVELIDQRTFPKKKRIRNKEAAKDDLELQYSGEMDTHFTMHLDDDMANRIRDMKEDGVFDEESSDDGSTDAPNALAKVDSSVDDRVSLH